MCATSALTKLDAPVLAQRLALVTASSCGSSAKVARSGAHPQRALRPAEPADPTSRAVTEGPGGRRLGPIVRGVA